ncbi:uncharacterized protein C8Q71DRAFT_407353 [Rhodofomes roseus]|uniref:F-box domain-containing protein n=1 Tax=Rhodofomes roseus TaxID=34475 RepID=A0ABQ8JZI6_9APHY|nr:uncharacterized protein C8Q71DRAFT_407353 [Rhodofomes roseus]KAH9829501.1 hypothetical protein C8Q71DRAFT_407353 [Rhodofomes roseus]
MTRKNVRLPIEIVMNILETAYDDHEPRSNANLYTNCALVCKDWSVIAQKLLFHHVCLHSQTAYIAFQDAVDRSTLRGRMLGDAVQEMQVTLDHNQPYRLSHRSFARAVTLCPNLLRLGIALYGKPGPGDDLVGEPSVDRLKRSAPSFDERTLAILRKGPRITSLQFSNWSDNSSSLAQLLDIWPSLKSLLISGTPPQLPSTSPAPSTCALEELRMNFQSTPSIDFMKWLLHNSQESLRMLELERDPSPELLDYLLREHAPTLESLALPTCGGHEGVASILQCTALRELRVESAWAPQGLFSSLPEGVRHIAFGVDMDTSLQPVLRTIKKSDALRVVTAHVWHGGERHPQLNALKIACARQGVDLRFTRDVRAFRAINRGVLDSCSEHDL